MAEKKWITKTGRYDSGRSLYYNKIKMASWFWDAGAPPKNENGEKLYYKVEIFLPVIKFKNSSFLTQAEAEAAIENAIKVWIDWAGLQES